MDHDSRPRHVCPELPRFLQPSIGNLVSSRPGIATENGTTLLPLNTAILLLASSTINLPPQRPPPNNTKNIAKNISQMATTIDSKVAQVLDSRHPAHDSDDEDALIAELEDDEDTQFSALREKRLQQLHQEVTRAKLMKETSHGTYCEIKSEESLMEISTSEKLCIIHFMKPDFNRCGYMDSKLAILAEKHFDTRFVSINVENAPFLVVKLGIKVLPCVIAFKDGVSVDRLIGFEGIGYKPDEFTTKELEERLLQSGVLVRNKMNDDDDRRRARREQEERERDELWDEDE